MKEFNVNFKISGNTSVVAKNKQEATKQFEEIVKKVEKYFAWTDEPEFGIIEIGKVLMEVPEGEE